MNREQLLASIRNITGETDNQIYRSCCRRLLQKYEVMRPSEIEDIPDQILNARLKHYLIGLRENLPDEGIEGGGKRKKSKKSKKTKSKKTKSKKTRS